MHLYESFNEQCFVCSLGWNDFMSVASFTDPAAGYFVDDTAIFSATFHIIKESCTFNRSIERGTQLSKSRNRLKAGTGVSSALMSRTY